MQKIILMLLGLAAMLPARAQYDRLGAAEQSALQTLDDRTRTDSLIEWSYRAQRAEAAAIYARAALELAGRSRYARGRADGFVKLGHLALDAGRYEEAAGWYERGRHIRDSLGLPSETASCYNNLGLTEKKRGRYDAAVAFFLRGLDLLKSAPADKNAIPLHNNLGTALRLQGKYEAALDHFQQSMAVSRQRNSAAGIAKARLNIANLLQDQLGEFEQARDSLNRCLDDFTAAGNGEYIAKTRIALANNAYYAGRLPEALALAEQALASGDLLSKDDRSIALKNQGRYLLDQREYSRALTAFQTALENFTALGNAREAAAARFEIGNLYYEQAEPAKAVEYYRQALDMSAQDPNLRSRVLYFLSDALDQTGQKEEAARYTREFVSTLKRVRNEPTTNLQEELIFFTINKSRVKTEMALRDTQQTRAAAAAALAVALLGSLFVYYRQRQRRRLADQRAEIARQAEELARREAEKAQQDAEIARQAEELARRETEKAQQDAEIARQAEELARRETEKAQQDAEIARQHEQIAVQEKLELLKSREVETTYARLQAQDEMQQKIGRELHDNIGAMLTTVRLRLAPVDEVLDTLPGNTRQEFTAANRLLLEACEELRRLSHQLSSATLMQFGLEPQLCALADNTPLKVNLELFGLEKRLDFNVELNVYRIIQELVQNVVKHARAKNVNIAVSRFPHRLSVLVEDDGRGFDPEKIKTKPGLGLQNLAARLKELGGDIQIDTAPGRGANMIIEIPLG